MQHCCGIACGHQRSSDVQLPTLAVRHQIHGVVLQIKQEAELRGHSDTVTNLSWHPTHPDKLASIAGAEKSVRCVRGWPGW